MITEQDATTFSPEEAANVSISCAFSATAYDLMPNFEAILKTSSPAKQHKIKLFDLFADIAKYVPTFLLTGERFNELLRPEIEKALNNLDANDMMATLLLKNQANLIGQMTRVEEVKDAEGEKTSNEQQIEIAVLIKAEMIVKVEELIKNHQGETIELRRLNEIKAIFKD